MGFEAAAGAVLAAAGHDQSLLQVPELDLSGEAALPPGLGAATSPLVRSLAAFERLLERLPPATAQQAAAMRASICRLAERQPLPGGGSILTSLRALINHY